MKTLAEIKKEIVTKREGSKNLPYEERRVLLHQIELLIRIEEEGITDEIKINNFFEILEAFNQYNKTVEDEYYNISFSNKGIEIVSESYNKIMTQHTIEFINGEFIMKGIATNTNGIIQYIYGIEKAFHEKKLSSIEAVFDTIHIEVAYAYHLFNKKNKEMENESVRIELDNDEMPEF